MMPFDNARMLCACCRSVNSISLRFSAYLCGPLRYMDVSTPSAAENREKSPHAKWSIRVRNSTHKFMQL